MRVYCPACHVTLFDIEHMPARCPECKSRRVRQTSEELDETHPWDLSVNDEKFLRDRGIAR